MNKRQLLCKADYDATDRNVRGNRPNVATSASTNFTRLRIVFEELDLTNAINGWAKF